MKNPAALWCARIDQLDFTVQANESIAAKSGSRPWNGGPAES
jgi:hypothetical protein